MPPAIWNEPLARLLESQSIHALDSQALNQTSRHFQPGFELNLTCQGRGTLHVGKEAFPVSAGTLVFIPERTIHQLEVHTLGRYRRSVLCIAPPPRENGPLAQALRALLLQPPFRNPRCLHLDSDSARLVRSHFARIAAETAKQAGWWKEMTMAQSCELLATAARLASLPARPAKPQKGSLADEIAAHIDSHLDEDLTVERLARKALMSPRTFARKFRAETGTTPNAWLNRQRLLRAQQLLEETDLSLEEIARETGFGAAAVMRHHFLKLLQTTPTAYRRLFGAPGTTGDAARAVAAVG